MANIDIYSCIIEFLGENNISDEIKECINNSNEDESQIEICLGTDWSNAMVACFAETNKFKKLLVYVVRELINNQNYKFDIGEKFLTTNPYLDMKKFEKKTRLEKDDNLDLYSYQKNKMNNNGLLGKKDRCNIFFGDVFFRSLVIFQEENMNIESGRSDIKYNSHKILSNKNLIYHSTNRYQNVLPVIESFKNKLNTKPITNINNVRSGCIVYFKKPNGKGGYEWHHLEILINDVRVITIRDKKIFEINAAGAHADGAYYNTYYFVESNKDGKEKSFFIESDEKGNIYIERELEDGTMEPWERILEFFDIEDSTILNMLKK